jgi:hypothetical protein
VVQRRSIGLSVALAMTIASLAATPVLGKCNPNRADDHNYYWVSRAQTVAATGIYSSIYTYSPWVVNGSISYAWVMLGGNGSYHWAQVGDYEVVGGVRHTTIQYAWSSTEVHQIDLAAQTLGSSVPMEVTYNTGTMYFDFLVNSVLKAHVHITAWVPAGGTIASEISTFATQMMGATTVNEVFNLNQIQYSGAWHTFNGVLISYNPAFGESGSGAKFNTWDGACTS